MTISQSRKKKAITHPQITKIPKDGWTVVLKYTDKPNQYVGWQTKVQAQREMEYLKKEWKRNPWSPNGPIKMSLKKLPYEEWIKLI